MWLPSPEQWVVIATAVVVFVTIWFDTDRFMDREGAKNALYLIMAACALSVWFLQKGRRAK